MTQLPRTTGLGFKPEHFHSIMAHPGAVGFFEVHAENYMGDGGAPHAMLTALRADHELSIHGVGLSIGGAGGLNLAHLDRLRKLIDRYQPASFSEHLAWSSHGAAWLNDLLPLPYTHETLATICAHINQVQDRLGCQMLLENPATYVTFEQSTWSETDFLTEITRRTGCGLLLDINNVFVSATNHRFDARTYLAAFPLAAVGEIHLAGHDTEELPSGPLLIDSHGAPVADPVWALYAHVLEQTGPLPTLIEWDTDVPAFSVLLREAARADTVLAHVKRGKPCAA
ncbi:MNIO family bufferin maturase [Roseinatronobacter sp. NSM]|uniref:MNIO family bufferin maturase n=1 Tax=Roseinatronobacter sp. NSM TaxID=3457785 RepID=UPI0040350A92